MGRETGPGDIQDVGPANPPSGPELRSGETNPLVSVGTDLVGKRRAVGVAPGLRAANQIQDTKGRTSHSLSMASVEFW